jgi:L-lactate dehydrogenase (cytochrome)
VQTWEDALEAYDQNLAGVVLSNHGGRQLDFARSGIEVLVEVVEKFKEKRGITFPNDRFQLFVDGGVRRATDVLKAIALGATAGAYHEPRENGNPKFRFSGDRQTIPICILDLWR